MTGDGEFLGALGAGEDGGSDKLCFGKRGGGGGWPVEFISMYVEESPSSDVLEDGLISTYKSSMYSPSSSK